MTLHPASLATRPSLTGIEESEQSVTAADSVLRSLPASLESSAMGTVGCCTLPSGDKPVFDRI